MIIAGLLVGIFISQFLNQTNPQNYDSAAVDINTDLDQSEEEFADNIAIPCFDTILMKANQTEQEVNFYNPERNNGINFKITITLDDGTILYESALIPNGKAIYNITTNKALDVGTYKATLTYDCFTQNGSSLNGSNVSFNLIMEE